MAALTSSAVSLFPTNLGTSEWYTLTPGGKRYVNRRLKLVLATGQGASSNTIGAAALGFRNLVSCSNFIDVVGGKVYLAAVDPVNNIINLAANGSDGVADVVAASGGYITVTGEV